MCLAGAWDHVIGAGDALSNFKLEQYG